jgi:hypothetical protein
MCCDPVLGQDLLPCADSGRAIFEVDADQPCVLRHRADAVPALGQHEHLIPGLVQARAAPPLPADRLLPPVVWRTLEPGRRRQGDHWPRQEDVYAYRPCGVLGRM